MRVKALITKLITWLQAESSSEVKGLITDFMNRLQTYISHQPDYDDMSSVDRKGLIDQNCEVLFHVNTKSPDFAGGVDVNKDDLDARVDDQSIMFGYATNETEDAMPLAGLMATRLGKKLSDVHKNGDLRMVHPHGKTQVMTEHVQGADESLDPRKIHTVVTHATRAAAQEQEIQSSAQRVQQAIEVLQVQYSDKQRQNR